MSATVTFRTRGDGVLRAPGVTIEPAPNAHGCGSPICVVDSGLLRVEVADRERPKVLCSEHAEDHLARELWIKGMESENEVAE